MQLFVRASLLRGVVYRWSEPTYATKEDLLTGEGSRRFGGRWNPRSFATVYAAFTGKNERKNERGGKGRELL